MREDDDSRKLYECIGKVIAYAGAIEDKIDSIIADEYAKDGRQMRFIKEVLKSDAISFSKKIDLLFVIMKRRKLKFQWLKKDDLKKRFLQLRNDLAHCKLEFDRDESESAESSGNISIVLKFKVRNRYYAFHEKHKEFEELGMQLCMELERAFWDVMWGEGDSEWGEQES